MKVVTKTAKSELNKFNFEFAHGTTGKFFQTGIAEIMEVRKGVKMQVQLAAMRRIDPMPLPPMSSVKFHSRFFYVPMIDITPYYNDMDARTPYTFRYGQATSQFSSFIPEKAPKINTKDIKLRLFQDLNVQIIGDSSNPPVLSQNWVVDRNDYVQVMQTSDDMTAYNNFVNYDGVIHVRMTYSGQTYNGMAKFVYTERGRVFFKLLKQLGYDYAITDADYFNQVYQYNKAQNDVFTALPLLAYLKVYLNFYESSQYINNTTRLARLNSLLHIDVDNYALTDTDLDLICDCAMIETYEDDYFTLGFVNPANGNSFLDNNESISMRDIDTDSDISISSSSGLYNGTSTVENTNSAPIFSQNSLNLLKRLNAFLKRHQVAGGRMVDRVLAEYGVSIESSYSRRSSFIDSIDSVMSITPVLNTAENLGEFAGFGSAHNDMNDNTININIPEQDGYIIVVDSIIPEIFYSQGYSRQNRHLSKFDFVAATDFDAVGVQATEQGELLMSKEGIAYHNDENPSALTHSFLPRGAEYKMKYNRLTGDFVVNSVNTDIDGYFTDRRFDPVNYLDNDHKINLTTGHKLVTTYDSYQYSRIFYAHKNNTDYIKSIFRFRIEMYAPYRSLFDEYKLADLDGNHEVKMQVGGQTMR